MDNSEYYFITCPNCEGQIIVHKNEVNCKIFRHAVYKNSLININPHAPKQECDQLFNDGKIYGCGKPFQLIGENGLYNAVICDYI
jgi:hypothetical protein